VTDLAPIRYAIGTITIWHGVALLSIMAASAYAQISGAGGKSAALASFPGLALTALMIGWLYLLVAPVVGQLVGDKYPFAMVWPSALVLGGLVAAGFLAAVFVIDGKPMSATLAQAGAFAFVLFTAGLSAFVCFAHYVLPRVVGIVSCPKLSWGVQL